MAARILPVTAKPATAGSFGVMQCTPRPPYPSMRIRTLNVSIAFDTVHVSVWRRKAKSSEETGLSGFIIVVGSGAHRTIARFPSVSASIGLGDPGRNTGVARLSAVFRIRRRVTKQFRHTLHSCAERH